MHLRRKSRINKHVILKTFFSEEWLKFNINFCYLLCPQKGIGTSHKKCHTDVYSLSLVQLQSKEVIIKRIFCLLASLLDVSLSCFTKELLTSAKICVRRPLFGRPNLANVQQCTKKRSKVGYKITFLRHF